MLGLELVYIIVALVAGVGLWIVCLVCSEWLDWQWPYAFCFPCASLTLALGHSVEMGEIVGRLVWFFAFLQFVPYAVILGIAGAHRRGWQCLKWIALAHAILAFVAVGTLWIRCGRFA